MSKIGQIQNSNLISLSSYWLQGPLKNKIFLFSRAIIRNRTKKITYQSNYHPLLLQFAKKIVLNYWVQCTYISIFSKFNIGKDFVLKIELLAHKVVKKTFFLLSKMFCDSCVTTRQQKPRNLPYWWLLRRNNIS